jgi:hypothetical protein
MPYLKLPFLRESMQKQTSIIQLHEEVAPTQVFHRGGVETTVYTVYTCHSDLITLISSSPATSGERNGALWHLL